MIIDVVVTKDHLFLNATSYTWNLFTRHLLLEVSYVKFQINGVHIQLRQPTMRF